MSTQHTPDIAALKQLALAVTGWDNCNQAWLDNSEDVPAAVVGHISDDGETYPVATIDCDQYYHGDDSLKLARFYAAANPAAILALIEHIEQAEQQHDELQAKLTDVEFRCVKICEQRDYLVVMANQNGAEALMYKQQLGHLTVAANRVIAAHNALPNEPDGAGNMFSAIRNMARVIAKAQESV